MVDSRWNDPRVVRGCECLLVAGISLIGVIISILFVAGLFVFGGWW